MKIVADQNIPLVDELFSSLGEVVRLPGRSIQQDDIRDADILLVRSVTVVNEALLSKTSVKFVGSCTIGIDHLDVTYMEAAGICWAFAPGCNAKAVVQYVLSAMAYCQPQWLTKQVGIIGCGNIGKRLFHVLTELGVSCCVYDPLLEANSALKLVSLDEVLSADIITCHVPFTKQGSYPTWHLLGREALNIIRPDSLLINSSRGGVIDEAALLETLKEKPLQVVLDVWENEPEFDTSLLSQIGLGTPHIAGYSLEGKEQGSFMIYQALLDFLNKSDNNAEHKLTHDRCVWQSQVLRTDSVNQQLNQILLQCYGIEQDYQRLTSWSASKLPLREFFDGLRKRYPVRREYSHFDFSPLADHVVLHRMLSTLTNII